MKEVLVLKELDQIKALSSPYRIQILEAFDYKPANAKMIADIMMESHAKINYHIKSLHKAGLLILVEEVARSGIVEKYYQPTAKHFVVDSGSMRMSDSEISDSVNQYRIALFEMISSNFYAAIENKTKPPIKIQLLSDIYLTDDELKEVSVVVENMITELGNRYKERRPNTHRYLASNMIVAEKENIKED